MTKAIRKARDLLIAFLHDPPDKALDIRGHERRARRYLETALGDSVTPAEISDPSDPVAAKAERLPTPHWETTREIGPDDLWFIHPLSADRRKLWSAAVDEDQIDHQIAKLVRLEGRNLDTWQRFLRLWRLLPDALDQVSPDSPYSLLPADTRIPDHGIWRHADVTAALKAAEARAGRNAAFLSFWIGPVQTFISSARSLRDLWTGSMILSWLTFSATKPLLEELGPTSLVYPALRGVPMVDLWLVQKGALANEELQPDDPLARARRLAPCLPNRFLALVPWGPNGETAEGLAQRCRDAARSAWREIADAVRRKIDKELSAAMGQSQEPWDARWDRQIDQFFDVRTAVLPWDECGEPTVLALWGAGGDGRSPQTLAEIYPDFARLRAVWDAMPYDERPGWRDKDGQWRAYAPTPVGDWAMKLDVSARLMEAVRAVRHVPPPTTDRFTPPKCSLMGDLEQLGPAELERSRAFWQTAQQQLSVGGVRLRDGERFCAVAMVKRFAGPAFFRKHLQVKGRDLRYDDVATVAAATWLERAGVDPAEERDRGGWNGPWLHWPRRDQEPDEACPDDLWKRLQAAKRRFSAPPTYYAALVMDGDKLGAWLSGEQSPEVQSVVHPVLVSYYKRLGSAGEQALGARRPVGPALHAAISEALANFALYAAPHIVQDHHGVLVYCGGDDTLALLPAAEALQCASELRNAYRSEFYAAPDGRSRLMMGRQATLSAGVAIVHIKSDLRLALEAARAAERRAKESGRDLLVLAACRRSGEHTNALCPWSFVPDVEAWRKAFEDGASDRWAYRLRAELPVLKGLEVEAMAAELRRQVNRAEETTRRRLGRGRPNDAAKVLADAFASYCRELANRTPPIGPDAAIEHFITLCQSASFIARGRD